MPEYNELVKNLFLPVGDYFAGTTVKKRYSHLMRSKNFSKSYLEKHQTKKLRRLVHYVYHNTPYYHNILKERNIYPDDIKNIDDLKKFPILTKEKIRANFKDFLSQRHNYPTTEPNKGGIGFRGTGGSTGETLNFYCSKRTYSWHKAATYRAWSLGGHHVGDRMVTLAGSSLSANTSLKNRFLYKFLERVNKYSSFDLSKKNMKIYANSILKYKPQSIRGYSNSLALFSRFLIDNDIKIPRIKSVFSAAEKLNPDSRQTIERAFESEVYDNYGAQDGSVFANECSSHLGLHLDMELSILEINRDNENAVDEYGDMLTTSLVNFEFPFIRYQVGDMGKISDERCDCGMQHTLLKDILGRNHDFIRTSDGTRVHGEFFSHLIRQKFPEICQFQVTQKSLRKIEVKIRIDGLSRRTVAGKFKEIIQDKFGSSIDIEIIISDEIKPSPSGKWQFVISEI